MISKERKLITITLIMLVVIIVILGVLSLTGVIKNPFVKQESEIPQSRAEFIEYIQNAPPAENTTEDKKKFIQQIENNLPPTPAEVDRANASRRDFIESLKSRD